MSLCVSVRRQETYVREGLILFDSCLDVLKGNLNRNALRPLLAAHILRAGCFANVIDDALNDFGPSRLSRLLGHRPFV